MADRPDQVQARLATLHAAVEHLRAMIQQMELERDRRARAQRRRLVLAGIIASVLAHAVLLAYLSTVYRAGFPQAAAQPVSLNFAVLDEQTLTERDTLELDAEELRDPLSVEVPVNEAAQPLEITAPTVAMTLTGRDAGARLGGAGDPSDAGRALSGGGAGTSFFGISSRGSRFAYILDISASMQQAGKLQAAMAELVRSIDSLPDYGSFYIVLFESEIRMPPMQQGWLRAREATVRSVSRWLAGLGASGSTEPLPAFHQVFALADRPDAIYFLTDGEIPSMTAGDVRALNQRGRRVAIHTVAYGNDSGQDLLRELAAESGGTFRFVPVEERRWP